MQVLCIHNDTVDIRMRSECVKWLHEWCGPVGNNVRPFTSSDNCARMRAAYAMQDTSYVYTDKKLEAGQWAMVRVRAHVQCIGSNEHKVVVSIVDAVPVA